MATDQSRLTEAGNRATYTRAQLRSYLQGPYSRGDWEVDAEPDVSGAVATVEANDDRLVVELQGAGFDAEACDGLVVVFGYDAPGDFTQYTEGDDD